MKIKRLIFTPLLILASILAVGLVAGLFIIFLALIAALAGDAVDWFPSWALSMVPDTSQLNDFFTGLAVLVTILLAALGAVAVFIKFVWEQSGWNTASLSLRDDESPLRKITLDELRERPGKQGGSVKWIDRGATKPSDLSIHNRVVITGQMKLGKTREAVELIRRIVVLKDVSADRIFEPSPTFRFFNRQKLLDALKDMDPHPPILLFLDDFPFYYADENLDRLSDLLSALKFCKSLLIVATARLDQLTNEHHSWIQAQEFHEIRMPELNAEQTAHLLDAAAGVFRLQIDDSARTAFLKNRDGTPELTIMALRRLHLEEVTQVNIELANKFASESLADSWKEARGYILKKHPAAEYIFESFATFHSAHVTPFTSIVLAYASYLWGRSKRSHSLRRGFTLKNALLYLQNFDIVVRSQVIVAPDIISEDYISQDNAEKFLEIFLLAHHRLFQISFLRRFYSQGSFHARCLFNLGLALGKKKNFLRAIDIYTASLRFHPHCDTYNNRGSGYSALENHAAALADFNKAIKLKPDFAIAYYNRGVIYDDLKDYHAALADCTEAIKLKSDFAEAYYNRSVIYSYFKNYSAALADCTKTIELQPNHAKAYSNRGIIYVDLKNYPAALADYAKTIELEPNEAIAYYNMACLYAVQSQTVSACDWLRRAILLLPTYLEDAKADTDFDLIRNTPEFQALLSEFSAI